MPGMNARCSARCFVLTLLRAGFADRGSLVRLTTMALAGLVACAGAIPGAAAQGTTASKSYLSAKGYYLIPNPMSCTVTGAQVSGETGPTGTATFTDVTEGQTIATAPLGTPSQQPLLLIDTVAPPPQPATSNAGVSLIATADFNGDGNQDMVVAVYPQKASLAIDVILGNGDGTFQAPTPLNAPTTSSTNITGLLSGDFNGDGKADVAVAVGSEIVIYFGNGDGTFQTPVTITVASPPSAIVDGDFTGNGISDLAVFTSSGVIILSGNSSGTFTTGNTYPIQTQFSPPTEGQVAIGDLRGNGKLDLIIAGYNAGNYIVAVMLGNGDGTFQTAQDYALPSGLNYPTSISLGDMNNDTHLDVVVSGNENYSGYGYDTPFSTVLLGNGDGTLQAAGPVQSLSSSNTFGNGSAVLDVNGDGNLDLVVGGSQANSGGAGFWVLYGTGAGTFETPVWVLVDPASVVDDIVTADWNNAGHPGFAIADPSTGAYVFLTQLASAIASLPNGVLTPGTAPTHTIECSYGGDASYAASTSAPASISIAAAVSPTFLPAPGTYATPEFATLIDPYIGASGAIYYTTDGTPPSSSSTLYTGPIPLSGTETVKAIAYETGYVPSPVVSATYTLQSAAPVFTPAAGTYVSGTTVTLSDAPTNGTILYSTDGTTPSIPYTGPITLTSSETIEATASLPTLLNSAVASANYTVAAATGTPVISPAAGGFIAPPEVTISPAIAGTPIYYTINGQTPTSQSTLYTGPFTLPTSIPLSITVKAIAIAAGDAASPVASATYTNAATSSVLSVSGGDPYNMSCTVSGNAIPGASGPTGMVTFTDTTINQTLASVSLGTAVQTTGFTTIPYLAVSANYPQYPPSVAVGDFNGDGIPDIASWSAPGVLNVALSSGFGTVQSSATVNLVSLLETLAGYDTVVLQPGSLAAADINGDGKLDLVGIVSLGNSTLSGAFESNSSYVFVLFGNGDGTFAAPTANNFYIYNAGGTDDTIVAGDFSGDGYPDLAILDDGGLNVFLNDGSGTLVPVAGSSADGGTQMVAGAFAAGPLDLVVAQPSPAGISVLVGNSDGTFQTLVTQALGFSPRNIVTADFNQDGKPDLALTDAAGKVWVLLGNGDGTFQTPSGAVFASGSASGSLVTADFNGDGIPDLAFVAASSTVVALGNGNGSFQTPTTWPFGGAPAVAARFTGNGLPVLATGAEFAGGSGSVISIYVPSTTASAVATAAEVAVTAGTNSAHQLTCSYAGDGNYAGSVSETIHEIYLPAATPTFSLNVGNYATAQTVTITDSSGGPIYYTNDGSTPSNTSTLYAGPITVSTTETLKAIAEPVGYTISPVSEAVYTITDPPAFSVPGGTYSAQQSVALTDGTAGAAIYYTTDGSTPGKTSAVYATTPIPIVGNMTLNAVALAPGNLFSPVVTATYSVPAATTTTAIQASSLTADVNQKITLTATVTGYSPTGTVAFSTGSQSLGSAPLTSGVATLQTSFATAGSYPITAAYSGDASNLASTSSTVTVVVAAPSFAVTSTPASQTINPGQSATFTFTVTPANGYTGTVNFACGTLPTEATCTFNQSSVVITGSAAGTSTLTISTQAPTTSRNVPPAIPFGPWSTTSGLALAGIFGLAFAPGKMRRWNRTFRALLSMLLLGALWLPLVGCGGGGGTTKMVGGTPAGSYTVSVTASDSAGGSSTSAQITLIVQ